MSGRQFNNKHILKENKYFEYLALTKANDTTISGPTDMIKDFGKANIV